MNICDLKEFSEEFEKIEKSAINKAIIDKAKELLKQEASKENIESTRKFFDSYWRNR